ncbi:hypothetical protein EDC56_2112 [Sinobacterium caligoides]|uniref:Uncharacterized protein n=1 Tax=Sinobacterium caligoides TaxID=933926 RepID=A0A3N2DPD0_9GAMM|nr:hypothetical protein EDC56_2112 [Sinobacterium caligoides]
MLFLCCAVIVSPASAQKQAQLVPGDKTVQELIVDEESSDWALIRWFNKPKSYSQCILKNISQKMPEKMVDRLQYVCLKNHSNDRGGLIGLELKPKSIDACFKKYRHKAGGRKAMKAIYIACEAYFKDIGSLNLRR